MKTKSIIEMDYAEFDDLASKTYGIPMECVALMEWSNDECHSFTVGGRLRLAEHAARTMDEIAKRGEFPMWCVGDVLDDMCKRGIIPYGEYVIKVSW